MAGGTLETRPYWVEAGLFLWRAFKKVVHLLTGKSEVERILARDADTDTRTTAMIFQCLERSKQLRPVFERITARGADPEEIFNDVCGQKLRGASNETRLRGSLDEICDVTSFVFDMVDRMNTPYDSSNADMESKLEKIWNEATNNRVREGGRMSNEWGDIGFQGKDPATDFRGGGLLALDQLLYVTTTRPEQAKTQLKEPSNPTARYPWACVGINITGSAMTMLKKRLLDRQLYGRDHDAMLERFNETYSDIFEYFHHDWVAANPENVLSFPAVFARSICNATREVGAGTLSQINQRRALMKH